MKKSLLSVLQEMRKQKHKGITFDNFPRGKHLTKRVSELRDLKFNILRTWEMLPGNCRRARYVLLKEPK